MTSLFSLNFHKLHLFKRNFNLFHICFVFEHLEFTYCIVFTNLDNVTFKLRCDERFTHAFTACCCVYKEITLVGSNQGNYFENATACSKRTLKTTVATQLQWQTISTHSGVNFINVLRANYSYERCFGSLFSSYMYVKK